eukprot:TRINITY_DN2187_c1_g1_i5.p1 TRINITY_DN2187_c1_g1~~TRINITY_DN2187_c1_g1_i5.p1  ORF type:complete len:587 (-),score=100.16 TRINITY_DN2187_c1_g1_i5:87-1649(-)
MAGAPMTAFMSVQGRLPVVRSDGAPHLPGPATSSSTSSSTSASKGIGLLSAASCGGPTSEGEPKDKYTSCIAFHVETGGICGVEGGGREGEGSTSSSSSCCTSGAGPRSSGPVVTISPSHLAIFLATDSGTTDTCRPNRYVNYQQRTGAAAYTRKASTSVQLTSTGMVASSQQNNQGEHGKWNSSGLVNNYPSSLLQSQRNNVTSPHSSPLAHISPSKTDAYVGLRALSPTPMSQDVEERDERHSLSTLGSSAAGISEHSQDLVRYRVRGLPGGDDHEGGGISRPFKDLEISNWRMHDSHERPTIAIFQPISSHTTSSTSPVTNEAERASDQSEHVPGPSADNQPAHHAPHAANTDLAADDTRWSVSRRLPSMSLSQALALSSSRTLNTAVGVVARPVTRSTSMRGPAGLLMALAVALLGLSTAAHKQLLPQATQLAPKRKSKSKMKVKKCVKCEGYGLLKCVICEGQGHVNWEGKLFRKDPCPLCFGAQCTKCNDCKGLRKRKVPKSSQELPYPPESQF